MKGFRDILAVGLTFAMTTSAACEVRIAAMNSKGPGDDITLWYQQPAANWKEGLPIGNGRIGAMVLGGVAHYRVALNHSRLCNL